MEKKIEDLEQIAVIEAAMYMMKKKLRDLNNPRINESKWRREVKVIVDDVIKAKKALALPIENEMVLIKKLSLDKLIDKTQIK